MKVSKPKYDVRSTIIFNPRVIEKEKYVTSIVVQFFKYPWGSTPGDVCMLLLTNQNNVEIKS